MCVTVSGEGHRVVCGHSGVGDCPFPFQEALLACLDWRVLCVCVYVSVCLGLSLVIGTAPWNQSATASSWESTKLYWAVCVVGDQ